MTVISGTFPKMSRIDQKPKARVLIVEDEIRVAEMLALMLKGCSDLDIETVHQSTLSGALEIIRKNGIHAVVLDLGLPDAHDLEALHRILEHAPTMPVVVVSGRDDPAVIDAAIAAGAYQYLVKPDLTLPRIRLTIRNAIAKRSTEVQNSTLSGIIVEAKRTNDTLQAILNDRRQTRKLMLWIVFGLLVLGLMGLGWGILNS